MYCYIELICLKFGSRLFAGQEVTMKTLSKIVVCSKMRNNVQ